MKFESLGGPLLITIRVTEDGKWHERLDVWLGDKEGWFKAEETELTRVK